MVPKVSVIVPIYNCENYISLCLESILSQTYTNIEIIIINDGSIDNSEEIIWNYAEKDNRIIYLYQENSGPSEARNKGILKSTGEYFVFIDSDDTVDEKYIELLLNKMLSSDADLVCCGYRDFSIYGLKDLTDYDFNDSVDLHSFMEMVCSGTGGVLWSKMFKKEIIIKNNLKMDKNIYMSEDLVFVLQYATYCKVFAAMKEYLYNYNRLNQESISSNISINYLQNYIVVCEYLEKIFRSVNFEEQKGNKIIVKRIQDLVLCLIEQQSVNLKNIGIKKAIINIKRILSVPYISKYSNKFSSDIIYYKPCLFFVKNKHINSIIIYCVYLNILKKLKRKIKFRKKVSV